MKTFADSARNLSLDLDKLADGMPGISPKFGSALSEAATVCFEEQRHYSGVAMQIDGDFDHSCKVNWNEPSTEQIKRAWADPDETTEHGAYGVAALLVAGLTEYTVYERSRKGTGFDSGVPLLAIKVRPGRPVEANAAVSGRTRP